MQMIASYLGFNPMMCEHQFNLRPAAGTGALRDASIISYEPTNEAHSVPVRLGK
jgi:hypothetical protein